VIFRGAAAAFTSARYVEFAAISGSSMTPSRLRPGTISLSTSRSFAVVGVAKKEKPVTLPSGWARLATSPSPTGSVLIETIGIVRVACLAARADELSPARMTSTFRPTNSVMMLDSRPASPAQYRY